MEYLVPLCTALAGGLITALVKSYLGRHKENADTFKSFAEAHSLILSDLTTEVRRLSQHVVVLESALRSAGLHVPSVAEIEQIILPPTSER